MREAKRRESWKKVEPFIRAVGLCRERAPGAGIVFDRAIKVLGLIQLGIPVKEGEKDGLNSFEDGFMAQGGNDVDLTHTRGSDGDEVERSFEPWSLQKPQDFFPGDFQIEGPID